MSLFVVSLQDLAPIAQLVVVQFTRPCPASKGLFLFPPQALHGALLFGFLWGLPLIDGNQVPHNSSPMLFLTSNDVLVIGTGILKY